MLGRVLLARTTVNCLGDLSGVVTYLKMYGGRRVNELRCCACAFVFSRLKYLELNVFVMGRVSMSLRFVVVVCLCFLLD